MFSFALLLISWICLATTRFPINYGNNQNWGFCPQNAELDTATPPKPKTCYRTTWDRWWAVITETVRNFTDNLGIGSVLGGYSYFVFFYAAIAFHGYMEAY
jgi:hypothetical protein